MFRSNFVNTPPGTVEPGGWTWRLSFSRFFAYYLARKSCGHRESRPELGSFSARANGREKCAVGKEFDITQEEFAHEYARSERRIW